MLLLLVRCTVWGLIALALTHCSTSVDSRTPGLLNPLPDLGRIGAPSETDGAASAKFWVVYESDRTHSQLQGVGSDLPTGFRLTRLPEFGTATLDPSTGAVEYAPELKYVGGDVLEYEVQYEGRVEGPYAVDIEVRARDEAFRNPLFYADVNNDGSTTALDALLIINRLGSASAIDPGAAESPDEVIFLDTNGNGEVTSLDALLVINALNNSNIGSGPNPCRPGENWVGNQCVLLGQLGDSCDAACSGLGGCDSQATEGLSSGGPGVCETATEALYGAKGLVRDGAPEASMPGLGIGCGFAGNGNPFRGEGVTRCDAKLSGFQRLCVCQGS